MPEIVITHAGVSAVDGSKVKVKLDEEKQNSFTHNAKEGTKLYNNPYKYNFHDLLR